MIKLSKITPSIFLCLVLSVLAPSTHASQPYAQEISFIRHGQSEDNLEVGQPVVTLSGKVLISKGKILSGWNASSLTMVGVSEAIEAGKWLASNEKAFATPLADAKWIYSPQLRTQQTLAGVLAGAKMADRVSMSTVIPDTRLMERSAGDVTNLTWDQASEVWPEMRKSKAARVFTDVDFGYPNGESLADVYSRASKALDYYSMNNKRLVIISHELTIKAMISHLTKGKIDNSAFSYKVENGKPINFVKRNGTWETMD